MEKLREACREWGIFRVVNHGVPTLLMDQIKSVARDLFSQPFESKRDHATSSSYSWGTPALTSSGRPLSVQEVNWVEGFNFTGFQMTSPDAAASSSSSDRTLVEEYGEHAGRIARKMVEAIGELLGGVDCGAYVAESTGIIRVYRYPQTHTAAAAALGMQPHTDSSVVSILLEDDKVSGLQFIKDDDDHDDDGGQRWLTLNPVSDTLLAISDDEFKSVKHRVKIDKHEEDRISICYFVFPDKDKIIETSKYKPFTYKDFQQQVQEDTKTLGFKVGLERFKRLI
ncbi:Gibberellin 2-beta-dioxygenase 8 [Linum perenne]